MIHSSKIIVALDFDQEEELINLVNKLNPADCRLKIGKTLFTQKGPAFVQALIAKGFEVFLDLKFHDIPQQVAGACLASAKMGVWMVNVHALGGLSMLKAAREAIDNAPVERKPLLIGVTVLTSMSDHDIHQIGIQGSCAEAALRLAHLCKEAQLDGVVCSAEEVPLIKSTLGKDFLCVTPGIRLKTDNLHDQKRVVTPEQAIKNGSDYLVMGRSITHAQSPREILCQIKESVE